MNIPCMARKNIIKKFTEVIENFQNVLKCPKARRCGERFTQQIDLIRQSLENGFDIITSDSTRVDELEDIYGVDFGDEEQDLHKDNCILNESGVCPRIRWCGGIDFKWQKKANERSKSMETLQALVMEVFHELNVHISGRYGMLGVESKF